MAAQDELFKKLVSHCKEYGFVFPASEIYDGPGAVYDYGPYGAQLRNHIKEYWWKSMVQMHENIVGIDAAIFMHPTTWKASGHVDAFNDPLVDNKDSKKRYRADVLIEEYIARLEDKINKEAEKGRKKFGEAFDEAKFRETHPQASKWHTEAILVNDRLQAAMREKDMEGLKSIIEDCAIADPENGSRNWTDVRQFNLMFSTQLGNIAGEEGKLYLRPETAQGIFVNFLNVQKTTRQKLPFGIAQIGKAFRNEIVARQFIFRMREFEQMEMQFFIKPGEEMKWYHYWKSMRLAWHQAIGSPATKLRFHDHENLAHYANAAVDIQFEFPFGFKEIEGIHSRTDFDLSQHQKFSGKKMQYFDPEINESYVPYVVETSIGLDRMFLAVMSQAFQEDIVPDADGKESSRLVLRLHPALAPVKCAVLPLIKNDERLTSKASNIFNQLKYSFNCQYDEKDAIGRRYRRQDAIGTPYCVTIDHETLENNTVTIRDRDTLKQERVSVEEVSGIITDRIDINRVLRTMDQQ